MKRFAIGLVLFCLTASARAQDDTTSTALPEIAPHEVEIRGTLEVSLPSLQRRPFVGEIPPVEMPRFERDRNPYIEPYKPAAFPLSESPLERPDPPSLVSSSEPPAQGLLETYVGRYFDRGLNARLTVPLNRSAQVFARGTYRGRYGHAPFEGLSDLRSEFDALELVSGLRASGGWWKVDVHAGGFYESFSLYGTQHDSAERRDGTGVDGRLTFATLGESLFQTRFMLEAASTRFWTRTPPKVADPYLNEGRIATDADFRYDTGVGDLWLAASLAQALRQRAVGTSTAFSISGGLDLEASRSTTITVGAMGFGVRNDVGPEDDIALQAVVPVLRAQIRIGDDLLAFAGNHPRVDMNTADDIFRRNPYLAPHPELRPSLIPVNVEGGATLHVGAAQLTARGGIRKSPQYLYFTHDPDSSFATSAYDKVTITYAGGSLSFVLLEGLHVMVGGSLRRGTIDSTGGNIPNFAPATAESVVSYAFLRKRGLLQVRGHLEGARIHSAASSSKLDPYLDLDVEMTYRITPLAGILLRIENLGNAYYDTQWYGYPAPPLVVGVGMHIRW